MLGDTEYATFQAVSTLYQRVPRRRACRRTGPRFRHAHHPGRACRRHTHSVTGARAHRLSQGARCAYCAGSLCRASTERGIIIMTQTAIDIASQVKEVNRLLEAGEPGNISTDEHSGYTGYKPQHIIDAMNDVFGVGVWGFEEVSSEIVPTGDKGASLAV